jgi:trimethylamine--corrinoid protein Co-methyltransferase
MTALLPALAGINSIYGMGMLEMGMTMSYEQLLIDAEIVRMTRRVMQGITVDDIHLAVDIMKAVGPGGTFLSQPHTRQFMRQELSHTLIFDRRMLETWEADGGLDAFQVANKQAREILENYKPDPLPESVQRELRRIVEDAQGDLSERQKHAERNQ